MQLGRALPLLPLGLNRPTHCSALAAAQPLGRAAPFPMRWAPRHRSTSHGERTSSPHALLVTPPDVDDDNERAHMRG